MPSKILSRRTKLLVIFTGFVLSAALLFYFIPKDSIQSGSALFVENVATYGLPASSVGRPIRLKIPKIKVDSVVEYVGLTPDGAMDVPKDRANTAWFELGSRPGEDGTAVIAGHYGIKNGKGSAFDNLYKLRKGDRLYIEDDKGTTISFIVRESRRYDPAADASDVFGSTGGKSHLNLITCEGEWDKVSGGYPQRLVVFTDKE